MEESQYEKIKAENIVEIHISVYEIFEWPKLSEFLFSFYFSHFRRTDVSRIGKLFPSKQHALENVGHDITYCYQKFSILQNSVGQSNA